MKIDTIMLGTKGHLVVLLAACAISVAGCMVDSNTGELVGVEKPGPKSGDPGMESNIISVSKFFAATPWLVFSADGSGRVDGVKFNVYLEGPHGPKGVFGTGDILVDMYVIENAPDGSEVARPIYKWEFSSRDAYPWRCKKETSIGWGYGLRLSWPETIDVSGRQVAFVVRYRRDDGKIINSSRQILRVPASGKRPIRMLDEPGATPASSPKPSTE